MLWLGFPSQSGKDEMKTYKLRRKDDCGCFVSTVKLVATAGKYAIVKSLINGRVRTEPDHPHGYVVLLDRLKPNAGVTLCRDERQ